MKARSEPVDQAMRLPRIAQRHRNPFSEIKPVDHDPRKREPGERVLLFHRDPQARKFQGCEKRVGWMSLPILCNQQHFRFAPHLIKYKSTQKR